MVNWSASQGVRLRALFPQAEFFAAGEISATSCCSDSRRVQQGDLFVALPGVETDGHDFVHQAIERGAAALLVERPVSAAGRPVCVVDDVRTAYGRLCQALAGDASREMHVTGITGTNGKTTTSQLTASILRAAGAQVGMIGTLGADDGLDRAPTTHTTPPAPVLAHWLESMLANQCTHAVLEVSSHALSQSRVSGIEFDVACFTNMRHDHLDYHGSLENYHRAKSRLLEHLNPSGTVVVNIDDPNCLAMLPEIRHSVQTIGMVGEADITARVVERFPGEQTFLLTCGRETAAVRTEMLGDHHVYNCLSAAAIGRANGMPLTTIVRGLESLQQVPGRMERLVCGQPFGVFVDYAHTADALETALATLRRVTDGKVFCVFGAGGNRDAEKRPMMARTVERHADVVVLTSDNPRDESPRAIIRDLRSGLQHPTDAIELPDRAEAIAWALSEAQLGDIVLVAGKGHEVHQVVHGQRYYFDDREVARDVLYQLEAHQRAA